MDRRHGKIRDISRDESSDELEWRTGSRSSDASDQSHSRLSPGLSVDLHNAHSSMQRHIFSNAYASTSAVRIEGITDDTHLPSRIPNPDLDPLASRGREKGKQKEGSIPVQSAGNEFETGERVQAQGARRAGKENEVSPLPVGSSIRTTIATATDSTPSHSSPGAGAIAIPPSHWYEHTSLGKNIDIPSTANENTPVTAYRTSIDKNYSRQTGTQIGDCKVPCEFDPVPDTSRH